MCTLISPNDKPKVLTEDMVVCKLAKVNPYDGLYYSPFMGCLIQTNTLLESEIGRSDPMPRYDWTFFNCAEKISYINATKLYTACLISTGFHSFTSLDLCRALRGSRSGKCIFECIIPKGSTIYTGYYSNIVSNKIIYKECVR